MRRWLDIGLATIVLAALAGGAWAQTRSKSAPAEAWKPASPKVVVYTSDKPPATPRLEDLDLKESVSQWGITWTFDKPARIGQFVNGDFFVVGPVVVVKIDPAPRYGKEVADDELDSREKVAVDQRCRNGSMLNAPARQEVAWDSDVRNFYHPEHRARLPVAMKLGDSLASSISLRRDERVAYPYHGGTVRGVGDNSPVKVVAVLTCVAAPLPPDAFRPGYSGHDSKIYLARNLHRELLPRFDRPAEAPDAINTNLKVMWNGDLQHPSWANSNADIFHKMGQPVPAGCVWSALAQLDSTEYKLTADWVAGLAPNRGRNDFIRSYFNQVTAKTTPRFQRLDVSGEVEIPAVYAQFPMGDVRTVTFAAVLPPAFSMGEKAMIACKLSEPGDLDVALYSADGQTRLATLLHRREKGGPTGHEDVVAVPFPNASSSGAAKLSPGEYRVRWTVAGDGYREFPFTLRPAKP
jgi:hypothetical protein